MVDNAISIAQAMQQREAVYIQEPPIIIAYFRSST
jgi:hypothetical protein